jgi:hypothetical protein
MMTPAIEHKTGPDLEHETATNRYFYWKIHGRQTTPAKRHQTTLTYGQYNDKGED